MVDDLFLHVLHNFINKFTAMSDGIWDTPGAGCRGLYPFHALATEKAALLEQIREYCREHALTPCDPIDGQTHDLAEIREWIWPIEATPVGHELALKFISLGIGLGCFVRVLRTTLAAKIDGLFRPPHALLHVDPRRRAIYH